MKTMRPLHINQRLISTTLNPRVQKFSLIAARAVQSDQQKRCDNWSKANRQEKCQLDAKAPPTSSVRGKYPRRAIAQLFNPQCNWAISSRASAAFLAAAVIKVEIGLLDVYVYDTDSGPCIPCYMSTVSVADSQYILEWRLFHGVTLGQATLKALNSMFEQQPNAEAIPARGETRYRYRGIDYEVVSARAGCVWLRPTGGPDRMETVSDAPTASHRPRRYCSTPQASAFPVLRTRVSATVKWPEEFHSRHKWIDRQPIVFRRLVRRHAKTLLGSSVRSTYRELAGLILAEVVHFNQSHSSTEQMRRPSWTTLYRLIRELDAWRS
jgi:hypothetical protein